MEIILAAAVALLAAGAVKWCSDRLLSRDGPRAPLSDERKAELSRKTARLVQLSRQQDFASRLRDIEILELGAFGADILGASLDAGKNAEDIPPAQPAEDMPVTVQAGEDVALTLRWRNTGEKDIREAIFVVAFLSPAGEALCPDALEDDPWVASFGAVGAARFTGHFPKGQGRRQRDMKNAFLLFHGPVETAVLLAVQLTYEDGEVFRQQVEDTGHPCV